MLLHLTDSQLLCPPRNFEYICVFVCCIHCCYIYFHWGLPWLFPKPGTILCTFAFISLTHKLSSEPDLCRWWCHFIFSGLLIPGFQRISWVFVQDRRLSSCTSDVCNLIAHSSFPPYARCHNKMLRNSIIMGYSMRCAYSLLCNIINSIHLDWSPKLCINRYALNMKSFMCNGHWINFMTSLSVYHC